MKFYRRPKAENLPDMYLATSKDGTEVSEFFADGSVLTRHTKTETTDVVGLEVITARKYADQTADGSRHVIRLKALLNLELQQAYID